MRRIVFAVLFVVTSCASTSTAPVAAAPASEPAETTPSKKVSGESCSEDSDCTAPARCIGVVGQMPESARRECWITCADDAGCIDGMTCSMIHDGPGQVCTNTTE